MTLRNALRSLALALALVSTLTASTAFGHQFRPTFDIRFPVEPDQASHHNDWGDARSGGRRHRGNDLMAPKMTGVYAFTDGVVAGMGTSPRSGRYLRIEHDGEWVTYYIHLNNDNIGTDDGAVLRTGL